MVRPIGRAFKLQTGIKHSCSSILRNHNGSPSREGNFRYSDERLTYTYSVFGAKILCAHCASPCKNRIRDILHCVPPSASRYSASVFGRSSGANCEDRCHQWAGKFSSHPADCGPWVNGCRTSGVADLALRGGRLNTAVNFGVACWADKSARRSPDAAR